MISVKEIVSENENSIELIISGTIYAEQASDLRFHLINLIEKGKLNITLQLTGLEYIDSAGLGIFISIHKRLNKENGTMVLKGLQGDVLEIFELTRLDQVLNIE